MASFSGYCQTPVFGDGHISVDYIKSHYKNNFDVYINCDYNVNNEDSVIFALVPHESNDPLNLVIQQLNFLFLESFVCKVDFLRILFTFEITIDGIETCKYVLEVFVNDFANKPAQWNTATEISKYCNQQLALLNVLKYKLSKVEFFKSQNSINTANFSQLSFD